MASTTTIGDLILKLTIKGQKDTVSALKNIEKSVNSIEKSMSKTTNAGNATNKMFGLMKGAIAGLAILSPIVDIFERFAGVLKNGIEEGFEYNSQMEKLHASMVALTGSQENATKLQTEIVKLSAETPFNIQNISKATKTLLGYGVAQEDVLPTMEMLGDISLGDSYAFDRLALAYGQITAKGKLMGEEVKQMTNNGFNPLLIISEATGESMASLDKKMRAGEISVQMVTDSLKMATSEGGRFYGSMELLSNTFDGQREKIKEYKAIFWGNLIRPFQDFLAQRILPKIVDHLISAGEKSEEWGNKLFNLTKELWAFIKPLYEIIKANWRDWLQDGIDKLRLMYDITKLLVGMVTDFDYFKEKMKQIIPEELHSGFSDLLYIFERVKNAGILVADWFTGTFLPLLATLIEPLKKFGGIVQEILIDKFNRVMDIIAEWDFSGVKTSLTNLKDSILGLWEEVKEPLKLLAYIVGTVLVLAWGEFEGLLQSLPNIIAIVVDSLSFLIDIVSFVLALLEGDSEAVTQAWERMKNSSISIVTNLWDVIVNLWTSRIENIKNIFGAFGITLSSITQSIKDKVANKFNELVEKVVGFIINLSTSIYEKYNSIKTKMSNISNNIKSATVQKWNELKSGVQGVNDKINSAVGTAWNNIKSKATSGARSAKESALGHMRNMRDGIVSVANAISPRFGSAIQNMINAGVNKFKSLISKVKSYMKDIKSATDLYNALYKSGKNMIQGLIDGIGAKFTSLKNKVGEASNIVKDFVGWSSPTKEGAGKHSDEWTPNLMNMMIDGMNKYKRKLAQASLAVSNTIAQNLAPQATLADVGNTVNTGTNVSSLFNNGGRNVMNITIKAESYDGESIGRALIATLNQKGILTHKI